MSKPSPVSEESTVEDRRFGVVARGKPLGRAVWTASRELAEDMVLKGTADDPLELWSAELVRRSP